MSQHDMNIANSDGATVRADINTALQAIAENHSGATAPSTTFAFQWWADTANDLLKMRNAANSAWISILTMSTAKISGAMDIVLDTTPQLGGNLDGQDNQVQKVMLKDYSELNVALATTPSSGTQDLDLESGNVFTVTLTDDTTFTFSNPIASDDVSSITLILKQDATGSRTVTWPASVDWATNGTAPTLSSGANDVDILVFITNDGGTTWYGIVGGLDFA